MMSLRYRFDTLEPEGVETARRRGPNSGGSIRYVLSIRGG